MVNNKSSSNQTVVRLFWPAELIGTLTSSGIQSCILLGAVMRCHQVDSTQLLVVAVISWCLPDALQQCAFSARSITLELAGRTQAATMAVVGSWSSSDADAPACLPPAAAAAVTGDVWLALRGSQQLCDALSSSSSTAKGCCQQLPGCCLEQSRLPMGSCVLQGFACSVPKGPLRQQQEHAEPGMTVPWMTRAPGGVTLAGVMQLLARAQGSIRRAQQQQQQQEEGSCPAQAYQQQQQPEAEADAAWRALATLNSLQPRHHQQQRWSLLTAAAAGLSVASAKLMQLRVWQSGNQDQPTAQLAPALWQHLLGLAAALMLLRHRLVLLEAAGQAGAWLQHQLLQPHVDWLMQAHPAGIKLHIELSILLGTTATHALQLSACCCAAAWPWIGPAALAAVAAAAALGAASVGCVAAADVLLVLAWPLVAAYCCFAWLHRLQLRCLAATWRLIRGKQKVRRFSERFRQQRPAPEGAASSAASPAGSQPGAAAAGDEVSVEQLIVGVLLFTPLLGLMPTTTAWYLSLCCCQAVLLGLRRALVAGGQLLRMQGLRLLVRRWRRPQHFPGQLSVQPLCRPGPSAKAQLATQHVSWYRAFYEPCSYAHLVHSFGAAAGVGSGAGMACFFKAVMAGNMWGLRYAFNADRWL